MEKVLIDFVFGLRKRGIKVSQAEVLDALRTLDHLALESRSVFKDALRSALVKRHKDFPVFDAFFDLHFSRIPAASTIPHSCEASQIAEFRTLVQDAVRDGDAEFSPIIGMIMTGSFGQLTRFLRDRIRALSLNRMALPPIRGRFFIEQSRRALGLDSARSEVEDLLSRIEDSGADPAAISSLRTYLHRSLDRVETELADLVGDEVARSRFLYVGRVEDQELADLNLFDLTEADFQAMRPVVDRLARRLKDRLGFRLGTAGRGRLDLKTTLRKNIGLGGPLPRVCFRDRKPARPQVVALCDVSRSVRDFSRFMLLFLYTLKEVIARIRSFIFVGDLAEVTTLFQQRELNEAVSLAAQGHGLEYRFRTDYGRSFSRFAEEHLSSVTPKTTVLIMGDARSNNYEPRIEALDTIAGRARKVIWLNPEPRAFRALGDSVMDLYAPYCTRIVQCGTLKQLSCAVENHVIA